MTLISNIQKYSIHDGEGIRTTVFFKGCPLSCAWCHNPDTQSYKKQVFYDVEKCKGCNCCIAACTESAINSIEGKIFYDGKKCSLCGECTDVCTQNLREIVGTEYSVKELVSEIKKDQMFYEESGGGVTLSGGEVMSMDINYMLTLCKALEKAGISINIDTCGYASYGNFETLLPYVDTFLYDIKLIDTHEHKKFTGKENQIILDNLTKLSKAGAKINLRIPTIIGVNATVTHMTQMVTFLKESQIQFTQLNLLPYHNMGVGKYDKLGMEYEGVEFETPTNDDMKKFQDIFIRNGLNNIKIGG